MRLRQQYNSTNKPHPYLNQLNITPQNINNLSVEGQLSFLREIYSKHIKSFVFHNFELLEIGHQHLLQRQALTFFNSRAERANGGFCFQSVQLLYELLISLDFTVSHCLARVIKKGLEINSRELLALPATHVMLVVKIDELDYLLDPGLGARSLTSPMLIKPDHSELTQPYHQFRFLKIKKSVYVLEKKLGDKWVPLIQTDLVSVSERRLNLSLLKLARHPLELDIRDSMMVVGIITDTGSKNLYWARENEGFTYSWYHEGQLIEHKITDPFEVCAILNKEFNIKHISTSDIEKFCSDPLILSPKVPWTVDLPLKSGDLMEMCDNLRK